jgi:hypothetical protein
MKHLRPGKQAGTLNGKLTRSHSTCFGHLLGNEAALLFAKEMMNIYQIIYNFS